MGSWDGFNAWRDKRLKRRPCAYCGKVFKPGCHDKKYCSRECWLKSVKKVSVDRLSEKNGFVIE